MKINREKRFLSSETCFEGSRFNFDLTKPGRDGNGEIRPAMREPPRSGDSAGGKFVPARRGRRGGGTETAKSVPQ